MKRLGYLVFLLLATACNSQNTAVTPVVPEWIETGEPINENYADVFWLCGTLIDEAKDSLGNTEYIIRQTDEQKAVFKEVALSTRKAMLSDSLNFFAPYYHQFTMNSIGLPKKQRDSLFNIVADEVYSTFHYYMENLNEGRPYVLTGLSQGGMLVLELLKRMSDEEYSGMVAAYSFGYGISPEDLKCERIKPAQGEYDRGVTISFNSVISPDGIWPYVYNDTQAIINPVNWVTDSTPASFERRGETLTVSIDPQYKVLIVEGLSDPRRMPFDEPWVQNSLHNLEVSLYSAPVKRNILERVYRY